MLLLLPIPHASFRSLSSPFYAPAPARPRQLLFETSPVSVPFLLFIRFLTPRRNRFVGFDFGFPIQGMLDCPLSVLPGFLQNLEDTVTPPKSEKAKVGTCMLV